MAFKNYIVIATLLLTSLLEAGTLIYKTTKGDVKTITDVTLISIDSSQVIIKASDSNESIPRSRFVKYFDSDIKKGEFDDSSSDYTIRIGSVDCPKTGQTKKNSKTTTSNLVVEYYVSALNTDSNASNLFFRQPYFYLAILVGTESGNREVLWYSYPKEAKCTLKSYDEVKMLEKVISSSRPRYYPNDSNYINKSNRKLGNSKEATFELTKVKDREIIAWHLIVWGKNEIISSTGKTEKMGMNISKTWWTR